MLVKIKVVFFPVFFFRFNCASIYKCYNVRNLLWRKFSPEYSNSLFPGVFPKSDNFRVASDGARVVLGATGLELNGSHVENSHRFRCQIPARSIIAMGVKSAVCAEFGAHLDRLLVLLHYTRHRGFVQLIRYSLPLVIHYC